MQQQDLNVPLAWLSSVEQIAIAAGEAIMGIYQRGESGDLAVQTKADESPVTEADIASHQVIVAGLSESLSQLPRFPILSEESTEIDWQERKQWQTYWLIDPLDGTKEFIKRNGEFTVNIALIHQGNPVLGVVYAPVLDKCYSGIVGKGAWLSQQGADKASANRTELAIDKRKLNSKPIVVGSRSHISPDVAKYVDKLGEHEMQSVGSSLKFCMVAEGLADVYPRLGPTSEWDTAAAQAVLEAAGGQVLVHSNGQALQYNQKPSVLNPYFIAASPAWFALGYS
ncbi:3'(2'),5'-bisphosphate nucleotidase [Shewanella maritima]|uniref:3'(2'),5'-bisphosphate nucleotidase CysQ n=1 Tax=Shewanella maritima TaxID=2520507 RepID=A0A411PL55_9GAMM|nr:3'(2'),5'-bisphosphate nucleotidase CysQ [Shewanella maritima]QBF84249.1 3'(2'),5'-bisphosphate nucleotidase [Shewanella maritima]